jgi:hypothetical protein
MDARRLLADLRGRDLPTLTQGKRNRVLEVEHDHVLVLTESSPGGQRVPVALLS